MSQHGNPSVVVLVGNPRPASRTRTAAERVAARIAPRLGIGRHAGTSTDAGTGADTNAGTGARPGTDSRLDADTGVTTVDLAALAPELFAAERPGVDAALRTVAEARVLVVATPVYKATYTGLLKVFLDAYGPDGLAGVVAVPLVVSGSPAHALVGEAYLRPLLVELGATVPARALTVTESELPDLDPVVDRWLGRAAEPLRAAVHRSARSDAGHGPAVAGAAASGAAASGAAASGAAVPGAAGRGSADLADVRR